MRAPLPSPRSAAAASRITTPVIAPPRTTINRSGQVPCASVTAVTIRSTLHIDPSASANSRWSPRTPTADEWAR